MAADLPGRSAGIINYDAQLVRAIKLNRRLR